MAQVYHNEERIPSLNLTIRGAATILLSNPIEVEGLQALSINIGGDARDPTPMIFDALMHENDIDLVQYLKNFPRITVQDWQETSADDLEHNGAKEIFAALGLAAAIWKNQGDDIPHFALALSICDPNFTPEPVIDMQGENPGWLLYKGSLRTTLFLGSFKGTGFVVGLFTFGVGIETTADSIVDDLRMKRLQEVPRPTVLPRIDQISESELANKCGVVLFLHGLLSTDVGTFDVLIDFLRVQGLHDEEYLFVSWPHNTLTEIEKNSIKLRESIGRVWNSTQFSPKLAFVCHSRGGLVARHVAASLLNENPTQWKPIISGCVTFGTPHRGTGLADTPDDLMALFIAGSAWRNGGLTTLRKVLWIAKRNRALEGVEDLRTMEGLTTHNGRPQFQQKLLEIERVTDKGTTKDRLLRVLALGGYIDRTSRWYYDLATRAMGGKENDVAVPIESATPMTHLGFERVDDQMKCDHFSYFSHDKVMDPYYLKVLDFLKISLDWEGCENRKFARHVAASGVDLNKYRIVGRTLVLRNNDKKGVL